MNQISKSSVGFLIVNSVFFTNFESSSQIPAFLALLVLDFSHFDPLVVFLQEVCQTEWFEAKGVVFSGCLVLQKGNKPLLRISGLKKYLPK